MRILFAEDCSSVAQYITNILALQGHEVFHVTDGLSAVESYRTAPPDLVLMDVVMPGMDGIEATRLIKAVGGERWIPLIIMTSLASNEELLAGLAAGADDYLIKPLSIEVLEARIRAMQRIALIQDRLYGVLDNIHEGIITIDEKGTVAAFNKAAEGIFGYSASEITGTNVNRLMPAPYQQEHDQYLKRYMADGEPRIIGKGRKVSGRRKNGEVFPMHLAVTELQSQEGRRFIGLVRDISIEEAAKARIEYLANHDALTGLPNRTKLNEILDEMLISNQCGYLLFIDLDGFKPINDQLGHETGDQALIEVARRLTKTVGAKDFVGRLGGDEFVAILPTLSDDQTALIIGQQMIKAISQPMQLSFTRVTCNLSASIGIAPISTSRGTRTEIMTTADNAMYQAKKQGKGKAMLAASTPPVCSS